MDLFPFLSKRKRAAQAPETLEIAGRDVPLVLRRPPRAKRLSLKIDAPRGEVVLVVPPRVSLAQGLRFLEAHEDWLEEHLVRLPEPVQLLPGTRFPFRGREVEIRHLPDGARRVSETDLALELGGPVEHVGSRVTRWLKKRAREEILPLVEIKAAQLGRPAGRVSIRDQRSRWGSCAANGNLAFSWRLILAPETILDYVVAHEVAHLREMNHSSAFWTLVDGLTEDYRQSRQWLKENGACLHRYG